MKREKGIKKKGKEKRKGRRKRGKGGCEKAEYEKIIKQEKTAGSSVGGGLRPSGWVGVMLV